MNVIICDDKKEEMEGTVYFCRDYFLKKGMPCGITATTEPKDIWKELPDILILDIEMPKMSGIEIKQRLEGEDKPLIIFVTGYEEHMPEAFGRNVIGFLMKPVKGYQLEKMLDSAMNLLTRDFIFTFEDGSAVSSKEILQVVMDHGYADLLYCDGRRKSWKRQTMKALEPELVKQYFIRIDEGCMVNCRYIRGFEGSYVVLTDGLGKLKVSRRRKAACQEKFREYCVKMAKYA